jgi:putative MATE family efflux protein
MSIEIRTQRRTIKAGKEETLKRNSMTQRLEGIRLFRGNPLWRETVGITWPAFIELVMSTMFGMVDMIMVGQLGPAAIAAVGLTNQPFMLLLAVFAAVNIGGTTLVAWSIGARDIERTKAITRQVIIINMILGLIAGALGIFAARPVVRFMGARPDTMEMATVYLQIIASGLIFQALMMGITACLRGAGETKIPMAYNVGSNLLNVLGNYVLIYGMWGFPRWGVAGAAVSTTLSRLIAMLLALYVVYFSDLSMIKIKFKNDYRINREIIKKVFAIGLPSAMEQFVLQSGLILFAKIVSGLGTTGFAAHQIGLNISGLAFSPGQAFGVAATTLVGQSLGAGDPAKAEQYAGFIHKVALGVGGTIALVFILFSHPLARLYTSDLIVAGMAGTVLKILALAQPGQATQLSLSGALRGAGDTMYPLYASILGIWVFRVGVAFVFVNVFGWGLIGAWVALALDQYTRSAVIALRFRSGKWKNIKAKVDKKAVETVC